MGLIYFQIYYFKDFFTISTISETFILLVSIFNTFDIHSLSVDTFTLFNGRYSHVYTFIYVSGV